MEFGGGQATGISRRRRVAAWLVHLLTASGAILGLLALSAISRHRFIDAFWYMTGAVIIDSIDGALARRAMTKAVLPGIDGALLDNMVDYFNYVIVPAFLMIEAGLLPEGWSVMGGAAIVLASAYQFSQSDSKTEDNFFKGFPSYWNIVAFYFFLWQIHAWSAFLIVLALCLLVFVPVKYVYPSRLDHLSPSPWLRRAMLGATLLWGAATFSLLCIYPDTSGILTAISIGYVILYVLVSLYMTLPCNFRRCPPPGRGRPFPFRAN